MQLFLEPIDVWLFRDGRPFDAFSDHHARSMFPPYPTVIQGALRSHHLALLGIDLRDKRSIEVAVGTATDYRGLRVRGPFLARREQDRIVRYFPQPADAIVASRDNCILRPASGPVSPPAGVRTSAPTPLLLGLNDAFVKGRSGIWLSEDGLKQYMLGREVAGVDASQMFERESRIGIGRDDQRRVAAEGAIYEVEFVRPRDNVGLFVEVQGYNNWPSQGIMRLGGEGRGARFQQVAAEPWPAPPAPLPRRFKVYFATPAYFGSGWLPEGWASFFEGEVTLVAAALSGHESVGGFDLADKRHKPSRRYVPAGSVYYFESAGDARLKPHLIQNAVTDQGAEIGFGQILVEGW